MTQEPPPGPRSPQPGHGPAPQSPAQQPPAQHGLPPQHHGPPGQQPSNGMAVAALVLGILAIVFFFVFFPIGFVLGVLAIVFGLIGRSRAKRDPRLGRKGMALAGAILGAIAIVLVIIVGVIIGIVISEADDINSLDQQEIEQQLEEEFETP